MPILPLDGGLLDHLIITQRPSCIGPSNHLMIIQGILHVRIMGQALATELQSAMIGLLSKDSQIWIWILDAKKSLRTKNRKLPIVIIIIMIHNHLLHHPSAWKRHQGGAQDQLVRKVAVYLHYRSPTSAALILRLVLKPWSATHQTSNFRKC